MSDTTVEVQEQIFNEPLKGAELDAADALVHRHKANTALTQQLALDASRLVATSQERLEKQSNAGFFKRFASTISGKNSENQLQNQVDILQMQKFAWHYLKQLQQQNLINAQSIAVIRNNLGTMNDYIIETRDFLEHAIDKINRRLEHVENNTRFNNWSLNIEANKRRFKSIPSTLLVLHLTYDFMRSHRDVVLTARDINYLVVTLEKLGVNCDENVELLDFIVELIDQIEITGIDRYREMIALSFDDHAIDSHFIQKNISGIGFNALYFLSELYEKIIDLIDDSELCNSDEARKKIISKFFGNEFSGLYTTYSVRDLIGEVIGGSLIAIDIYKDVNGLNVAPDDLAEDEQREAITLVSSLPDIHKHTFLDTTESQEDRKNYLRLFALCLETSASLNKQGQEFLALLSEKAGCPQTYSEIASLADSAHKNHEHLPALQALLNDTDKIYTWLIDAFFLLTLCERKIESPQILHILGTLKPTQFKENFPQLLAIVNESDETQVLNAATKLARLTQGWQNIVRYRTLRFDQTYYEAEKQLNFVSLQATMLLLKQGSITTKASEYSYFMGSIDDSFLGKLGSAVGGSAYALGRSSCLSSLNEMRKKAYEFISDNSSPLHLANRMIASWNIQEIKFNNEINYSDYDLDNAANNDDWYDEFSRYQREIDDALMTFSRACDDAADQLGHFKQGEFEKSVIELREKKHAERLLQEQQEKQEKQAVIIEKDGSEHLFSIEWRQVENPPCDPEKIRRIITNGKIWLIVDNDDCIYRSEDGEHWELVKPNTSDDNIRIRKLDIVNGVWILMADSDQGFYYSIDALTWRQSHYPELSNSYGCWSTEDLIYFSGLWLWRFTERTEYQYTEKGFIFDSEKTSNYYKTILFCSESLDAQWRPWEETPEFSEGVVVETIRSLPGVDCLLAFCKYDYSYISRKKKANTSSSVKYYLAGKSWRNCTWASDNDFYGDTIVTRMGSKLMCFYSNQLLISEKGYEWKLHSKDLHVTNCFHLENLSLFTSHSGDNQLIYLSQDAEEFKEYMLEDGGWQYFSANEMGALSVYSPNSHETFLRAGDFSCRPKV